MSSLITNTWRRGLLLSVLPLAMACAVRAEGLSDWPEHYGVGTGPQDVVTADFNNDGRLDLATSNDDNTVSVLLGDGLGGFGAANNFATGTNPVSLVVGDFNNDGNLDLATANAGNNTTDSELNSISILLGTSNGTFQPRVDHSTWFPLIALVVGDFNNDGNMDLIHLSIDTSAWDDPYVHVLVGDGQGSFVTGHYEYVYGYSPVGMTIADLNADGRLDVVTVDAGRNTVSVLMGNGDGSLSYSGLGNSDFFTGPLPQAVAVGDFTGDGIPDLITTGYWSGWVQVLPGRGDGTFAAGIQSASYLGDSLAVADFNGDDKLDVVTAYWSSENLSLLLSQGNGAFAPPTEPWAGWSIMSVVVGDFNADGHVDVAAADWGLNAVAVLLNDGVWSPLPPTPPTPPALRITDASAPEGNKGTTRLDLTVTLSRSTTGVVTVNCRTADGTALAKSDYTATSGTLTFQPGQTSRTISIAIKGDGKREPNETFSVRLSNPVGATIADWVATATILNDD